MTHYTRHNPAIPALELLVAVTIGEPRSRIDELAASTRATDVARAAIDYLVPESWLTPSGSADVADRLRRTLAALLDAELDED